MSAVATVSQLRDDPAPVRLSGVLSQVTPHRTRQGRVWASAMLTDQTGVVEVLAYPNLFEVAGQVFVDGARVALVGRADRSRLGFYVMVDQAEGGAR